MCYLIACMETHMGILTLPFTFLSRVRKEGFTLAGMCYSAIRAKQTKRDLHLKTFKQTFTCRMKKSPLSSEIMLILIRYVFYCKWFIYLSRYVVWQDSVSRDRTRYRLLCTELPAFQYPSQASCIQHPFQPSPILFFHPSIHPKQSISPQLLS